MRIWTQSHSIRSVVFHWKNTRDAAIKIWRRHSMMALATYLEWERQDFAEACEGIERGLAGRSGRKDSPS